MTEVIYVGFWDRFLAALVDTVALSLILLPLMWLLGLGHTDFNFDLIMNDEPAFPRMPVMRAGTGLEWLAYAVLVIGFWKLKSATPGKMVIDAIIVDEKTLGPPSTGQLIGRYFGYILSTLFMCFGFIWVAFDARKQGWHDKLAGTLVIRKRS